MLTELELSEEKHPVQQEYILKQKIVYPIYLCTIEKNQTVQMPNEKGNLNWFAPERLKF